MAHEALTFSIPEIQESIKTPSEMRSWDNFFKSIDTIVVHLIKFGKVETKR